MCLWKALHASSHFIWRRMSLSPLWKGMWKNSHILGSSVHARIKRSVKYLHTQQAARSKQCLIKSLQIVQLLVHMPFSSHRHEILA